MAFIWSKTKASAKVYHSYITASPVPVYRIEQITKYKQRMSLTADTNYSTLFTVQKWNQQKLVQVDTASIANIHCIFSLEPWVGGILRKEFNIFVSYCDSVCLWFHQVRVSNHVTLPHWSILPQMTQKQIPWTVTLYWHHPTSPSYIFLMLSANRRSSLFTYEAGALIIRPSHRSVPRRVYTFQD